jgi:hypothetical protein
MSATIISFEPAAIRELRLWEALVDAKQVQFANDTEESRDAVQKAYREYAAFLRWRKAHEPEKAA